MGTNILTFCELISHGRRFIIIIMVYLFWQQISWISTIYNKIAICVSQRFGIFIYIVFGLGQSGICVELFV